MADVATTPQQRSAAPVRELRRDPEHGLVAGVCAGIGAHFDIDPILLRIAFGATTPAAGLGIVAYLLAWMLLPAGEVARPSRAGEIARTGRAAVEIALGAALLLVALLLGLRRTGMPFSDVLVWPLMLVAAGGALLWRQSASRDGGRVPAAPTQEAEQPFGATESRPVVISRIGVGVDARASPRRSCSCSSAARWRRRPTSRSRRSSWWSRSRVIFAPWFVRLRDVAVARARGADPLAGARRGRRAPARLGPADARAGAEARRRPARGGRARAPPGARAALLAQRRAAGRRGRAPASPRRCRPRPRRSSRPTAWPSTSSPSATRAGPRRRGARRRRPRGDAQRREVRRRRGAGRRLRRGRPGPARGLRPRPRPGLRPRRGTAGPPRRARVDRRADGAPRRPRRDPRVTARRHRGRARHWSAATGEPRPPRARGPRRRPRACFAPACAPSSTVSSTSSGEAATVAEAVG